MSRVRRSKSPRVLKFQKFILPIIIALIVIAVVVVVLFVDKESKAKVGIKTYQYSMTERIDYDESSEVILQKQGIVMVDSTEEGRELDPTPLYSTDSKTAYLTKDMAWSDINGKGEWFVESLSSIKIDDNGLITLSYDGKDYNLDGGFLRDSGETYVFLDYVDLKVDTDTYELSPLSFYSGESGIIRIYDYDTNYLWVIDDGIYRAEISCEKGYTVDLIAGIMTGPAGNMRLLAAAPSVLQNISER